MPKRRGFYNRGTDLGFCSNFWASPQQVDGERYETNEHYYQSQKAASIADRHWIAAAPTPYAAKKAGRALQPSEMVEDWDKMKIGVMWTGLRAKFSQNHDLGQMLLDTGDAILFEDSPTDHFWGAAKKPDGSDGDNHLGKLLMQIREELRKQ